MLNMAAEITDLIQRIPCRNFHFNFPVHVGDRHRYVKEVLLRMAERNLVTDRRPARTSQRYNAHTKNAIAGKIAPPRHNLDIT